MTALLYMAAGAFCVIAGADLIGAYITQMPIVLWLPGAMLIICGFYFISRSVLR